MDKSLDQLIKENPKKYTKNGIRNNRNKGKPVGNKQGAGKVTKAKNRVQQQKKGGKVAVTAKKGVKKLGVKPNANKLVDARSKILAKTRAKIRDARERLAQKTVDLRQKLGRKRENNNSQRKNPVKPRQNTRPRPEGPSRPGPIQLTRTVFNTLNRENNYRSSPPRYHASVVEPEYRDPYSGGMKRSSAAMDWEPMGKRSRVLDSRLGPKEYSRPHAEPVGHKIVIDNLHPTVTQEDIEELFGDIGPLTKALLKRPGLGEVIYTRREDALRAVDVYHNRQLDGMPMQVSLFEPRALEPPPVYRAPSNSRSSSGKSSIQPDINTIHKALFNKAETKSQIFTVTLPKKDY